jgi:endo-1,4-beta-xylanase
MRPLFLLALLCMPAAAQDGPVVDTTELTRLQGRMRRLRDAAQAVAAAPAAQSPSLREAMARHGRWIGSAAQAKLLDDTAYAAVLAGQFSILTPENEMKFAAVHGKDRASYDFSRADALVAFARGHDMRVRGHTLVWYKNNPDWLTKGNFSPQELSDILHEHIRAVAGHFRGQVYSWDVVNEAVLDDGSPRPSLWSAIGPDYIVKAFRWAREADPTAKLFYNDQGLDSSAAHADAVYKLISEANAAGAGIDGIGLQMHTWPGRGHGDIRALIQRFADLGLEVHITEMDVALDAPATEDQLQSQARVYADAAKACLAVSACKAFVMWGFTDAHTFLTPKLPLIFDAAYHAKPAYSALEDAITSAR